MSSSPHTGPTNEIDRTSWLLNGATRPHGALLLGLRFLLFGLIVVFALAAVLYATWQNDALNLKAGQIANRTIKAPRTATFDSTLRTEEQRQDAYNDARNVVLRPDPSVGPNQTAALRESLSDIDLIRADTTATPSASKAEQVRAAVEGLSAEDAAGIVALSNDAWARVKSEAQRVLSSVLAEEIHTEEVAAVKEHLLERTTFSMSGNERTLVAGLVRPFVRANIQIDAEQTKAAREAAARAVEPIPVTVQEGQVIVRDGDPVTKYDIEKLEYFQLLKPSENWQQFAGILCLLTFVTAAFVFYLYKFAHGLWQGRQLLLVGLVIVIPVLLGRFLLQEPDLRYMFPAAGAAMLLAILLDFQIAVVSAGFLALYLGIVSGTSFEVMFVAFLSSLAGAAVIWRAERTMTFFWSFLAVAGTAFVSALSFALLEGRLTESSGADVIFRALFHAAINGAASASLTFLFFSLLGRLFGITTHLQLLELAHPNQPLLYRLAREAPGTYHHSIVVSNLAESAVELVGGDPLFARVAVLYHDVGKVLRPSFFVENQANRANVHDALDPHTSARIIQEHVLDGVRLARKARLPQPIIDVIEQHHGTTLIKYFYTQALNNGEDVNEAEFRYAGPRPKTKEAGVIMLADGVEAAVRAASQSGKLYEEPIGQDRQPLASGLRRATRLHEIVDSVIRARLEDGQLDDCDLTLKQIEQIRGSFIAILEGIYHPRIEYPELRIPSASQPSPETAPAPQPVEIS